MELKAVKIEDFNEIGTPSSLKYSPDGKILAFIFVKPDKETNSYKKNIWIMENTSLRQLTFSDKDNDFIWENNDTILFESGKDKNKDDDEEVTVFYRVSVITGEVKKAYSIKKQISFFKKISDGLYCMGVKESRNAIETDYHVIDEVPVWGNAKGFISGIRTAAYLYMEREAKLKKLTDTYFDTASVDIYDNKLLILGKEWKNVITDTDSLILYDVEKENPQTLVEQGSLLISRAVFCDGRIFITATDGRQYGNSQYHDLYEYDYDKEEPVLIIKSDCLIGVDIMTDCNYSMGDSLVISRSSILAIKQHGYKDKLVSWDLSDSKWKDELIFNGLISELAASERKLAMAAAKKDGCCEIYEIIDGTVYQRTSFNEPYLKNHCVSKAKYIPFTNKDGIKIDGWVLEPKDYCKDKSYPGILEIHGGPRCTYGEVFFHEMQVWASKGWFVFYCNPRGSEGYGEEFADLRGKYGTIDYEDLMEFTDHVLDCYPQINIKKIGAAGGSYGGFMCNWIEGHTDRFAAIASQRSVSNWVSDFGTSEIGVSFDSNEMKATPWNGMEKMWDCSPLKYACNAKTPILFIHSLNDYNCTLDQGIQMFTAVKFYGVPSRMCLFEGENHGLSRRGKPLHRIRRIEEMTQWFEKYLSE